MWQWVFNLSIWTDIMMALDTDHISDFVEKHFADAERAAVRLLAA